MAEQMRNCSKAGMVMASVVLGMGVAVAQATPGSPNGASSVPEGAMSAQQNMQMNSNMQGTGMKCSVQDRTFLKKATMGSNFEIKAGELAQSHSSSDDVKQFGQWMVQQHTQLNDSMKPVAQQAMVTPPTGLSPQDKAEYNRLAALHGQAFDKAYIRAMVKDHRIDLAAFKKEAADGQMASEKEAATNAEPIIQSHLDKITQIAQAHNVPTGGAASGM